MTSLGFAYSSLKKDGAPSTSFEKENDSNWVGTSSPFEFNSNGNALL
jgi:hypothetical protein